MVTPYPQPGEQRQVDLLLVAKHLAGLMAVSRHQEALGESRLLEELEQLCLDPGLYRHRSGVARALLWAARAQPAVGTEREAARRGALQVLLASQPRGEVTLGESCVLEGCAPATVSVRGYFAGEVFLVDRVPHWASGRTCSHCGRAPLLWASDSVGGSEWCADPACPASAAQAR